MLKKVLGKGKKANSPHEEEPIRKKRSTRRLAHGEGGSSQQPPQQSQEQQGDLSYAEYFVVNYPYLISSQHSW
ncbi:hypothetical protein A2U01_0038496, partial [Trifolium medium]|nr:hypothetical protein [Trifolium medium]